MRIRVINPNTTAAMTARIGASARAVAGPGVVVEAVTAPMGPASVESHYDEALSVPGVLAAVADGERSGVDGYVIACFGDPGLDAARELARGPVVGIAEAAMHAAGLLGRGFSVVTTLERTRGRAWDLAARYAPAGACRGVHAVEIPVLDLDRDPGLTDRVAALAAAAVAGDDADVVVLGCAGMADLAGAVADRLGLPVVDGVAAATVLVAGLVQLRLRTSDRGEFAPPRPKRYTGPMAPFTVHEGLSAKSPVSRGSPAM